MFTSVSVPDSPAKPREDSDTDTGLGLRILVKSLAEVVESLVEALDDW